MREAADLFRRLRASRLITVFIGLGLLVACAVQLEMTHARLRDAKKELDWTRARLDEKRDIVRRQQNELAQLAAGVDRVARVGTDARERAARSAEHAGQLVHSLAVRQRIRGGDGPPTDGPLRHRDVMLGERRGDQADRPRADRFQRESAVGQRASGRAGTHARRSAPHPRGAGARRGAAAHGPGRPASRGLNAAFCNTMAVVC